MNRIPAPNDSYDHNHSILANLTSLRATIASFEATIQSLDDSIEGLMERLLAISTRAQSCASQLQSLQRKLKDKKAANSNENEMYHVKTTCPALYETATGLRSIQTSLVQELSVLTKARHASQEAIAQVLREEAHLLEELQEESDGEQEDGGGNGGREKDGKQQQRIAPAKPADNWLDRASAFPIEELSQFALEMNSVPPLRVESSSLPLNPKDIPSVEANEADYYPNALQEEAQRTPDMVPSLDDASVYTEATRGTLVSNYSMTSHATASHRWQQRKMAAAYSHQLKNRKVTESSSSLSSSQTESVRNRTKYASLTYTCDMLHDTYGLGSTLDRLQGNDVVPPIQSLTDLVRIQPLRDEGGGNGKNGTQGTKGDERKNRGGDSFSTPKRQLLVSRSVERDSKRSVEDELSVAKGSTSALEKDSKLFQLTEDPLLEEDADDDA